MFGAGWPALTIIFAVTTVIIMTFVGFLSCNGAQKTVLRRAVM
jgi:hypothetical protein